MAPVALPDSPVGQRLRWFLDGVGAGTMDEAALADAFTDEMREAVPVAQMAMMVGQLATMLGELEVDFVEARSPVSMAVELARGDGSGLRFDLVVEDAAPHRLSGLLVAPLAARRDPIAAVDDLAARDVRARAEDGFDGELADELVAVLEEFVATGQVGLAAAVTLDGRTWSAEAGLASVEAGRAVRADTIFRAYSISKTVATAVVLALVDAGRLGLDDPVAERLTSYRLVPPDGADGPTLRHLLTHTAGVSSNFEHWVEQVGPVSAALGAEWPCDTAPGARWLYSNGGFATVGAIVEDVTGSPFEEVAAELVLRPLGMERSEFRRTNGLGDAWAVGYDVRRGMVSPADTTVPSVLAAGSLFTTASDLLRFVAASAADGAGVVPPELLAEGFRSQLDPDLLTAGPSGQGLAWMLVDVDGTRWATHGGGGHGFSTTASVLPGSGAGIVLLTNIGGQDLLAVSTSLRSAVQRRVG